MLHEKSQGCSIDELPADCVAINRQRFDTTLHNVIRREYSLLRAGSCTRLLSQLQLGVAELATVSLVRWLPAA